MKLRVTALLQGLEPLSRAIETAAGQLSWLGGYSGAGDTDEPGVGVTGAMPWKSHALLMGQSQVVHTRQCCQGHARTNVSVNPPGPKILAPAFEHASDTVSGPNQQALSQTISRHDFRVNTGQRPFPISSSCVATLFWWIRVFNSMAVASWPQGQWQ